MFLSDFIEAFQDPHNRITQIIIHHHFMTWRGSKDELLQYNLTDFTVDNFIFDPIPEDNMNFLTIEVY